MTGNWFDLLAQAIERRQAEIQKEIEQITQDCRDRKGACACAGDLVHRLTPPQLILPDVYVPEKTFLVLCNNQNALGVTTQADEVTCEKCKEQQSA